MSRANFPRVLTTGLQLSKAQGMRWLQNNLPQRRVTQLAGDRFDVHTRSIVA
jgi:hypothetical protein